MKTIQKNSLYSLILISLFSILTFSCNHTEVPNKDPITLENLKKSLPSPWSLKITPINSPPTEWKGPVADGIKVEIFNTDLDTIKNEEKAYKKLYPKSNNSQKVRPQLVRYLYTKLEAGYSFGMMQRIHPAILEGVTQKFVIIKPPFVSSEKDHEIPKTIKNLFYKAINFSLDEPFKQAAIVKKAFGSNLLKE